MTIVRFQITMSVDGYVAGPRQSVEHPLGEGGEKLHEWVFATRGGRAMLGMEGGATGPDHEIFEETFQNAGATIMGRNMFGGGKDPWGEQPWRGWWGENPPYHTHVFVITHHARPPLEMKGGTTFHFVTDGIHRALDRARKAAGRRDVMVAGGAEIARESLKAGVVEEMELHVVSAPARRRFAPLRRHRREADLVGDRARRQLADGQPLQVQIEAVTVRRPDLNAIRCRRDDE